MANLAAPIEAKSAFVTVKDTFIFDGNSPSAHIIARTILTNDPSQKFGLIPRQNTPFFGIEIPGEYQNEKFILITQTREVLCGDEALEFISQRLRLQMNIH